MTGKARSCACGQKTAGKPQTEGPCPRVSVGADARAVNSFEVFWEKAFPWTLAYDIICEDG